MEEKRKFVRLNINVAVKCTKVGDERKDILPRENASKDISGGGISIISYEELKEGDILEINIELPTKKVIDTRGRVVRTNEIEIYGERQEKRYEAGIEFLGINEEDREEILKFVFQRMKHTEQK